MPAVRLYSVLGLICVMETGCSFMLAAAPQTATDERHCSPARPGIFDTSPANTGHEPLESFDLPFTPRSLETAEVIEARPILSRLIALQQTGDGGVAVLVLRQQLTDRLLLAQFEVSSVVAELMCERDRADQVADRMEEVDASAVRRLTLLSIVIGGIAAVVSGGIGLAGGGTDADAAALAGGVVSSLLGGTALFTNSKQQFRHERNLLKDVWDNPARSAAISPVVWRFLQAQAKDGSLTGREEVVRAWRQQGRLGEADTPDERDRIALMFGRGGVYTASDLRARASMLETLIAHIQLLSEELELFLREFIEQRIHAEAGRIAP